MIDELLEAAGGAVVELGAGLVDMALKGMGLASEPPTRSEPRHTAGGQCASCKYKPWAEGSAHCYMFEGAPEGRTCGQYTPQSHQK